MLKRTRTFIKSITASLMVVLFCGGLLLSPVYANAQEDDGEKTWRKGHCFLKPSEDICRRKKKGDKCDGPDYCDTLTYLKTAADVAKLVMPFVK